MKKKVLGAVVLAMSLAVTPLMINAAGSPQFQYNGGGSSSSSSSTSTGTTTAGTTAAGTTSAGSTSSTTSPAGISVVNDTAAASANAANNTAPSFATGASETAGLPETTVSAINSINNGANVADVLGSSFAGFNTLTRTSALVTKNPATGAISDVPTVVSVDVPNLTANVSNLQVLFYNNVTGVWGTLPATVDPATKKVTFTAPCSGTFTFIYK